MKKQAEIELRKKCRFEVSLRYELLYSLNILLDPNSRIHPVWRKAAQASVGDAFFKLMEKLGGSWEIWPVLAALMPGTLSNPSFDEIIEFLRHLSVTDLQRKILLGMIHSEKVVDLIQKDGVSLRVAISEVSKSKQEWLSHIGLFPYDPNSPQAAVLETLIANPEMFRETVVKALEIYWDRNFKTTWGRLLPQLRRSMEAAERLFFSCAFAEFSRQTLLRIEVKERKGEIHAIRGGYRLRFRDIETCYFLPSAFNDRRFWSAFQDNGDQTTVYFPCFDPSVSLDIQAADRMTSQINPALDPALIFKALGDSTRFAIAIILARQPMASIEVAKLLSVSKPTISHHIHFLREAGLLEEEHVNGAMKLRLKRSTLEQLSEMTVEKLFDAQESLPLVRTRRGKVS
jgi:ArsR family transcriptional regulator, arsenate/arsenite/antimonite-responsive transcriptional repressor